MTVASSQEVTRLLAAWSGGDEAALEQLVPIIHAELHRLAKHYLKRERAGHTLQTSALVNEAYVRLIDWKTARWESRAHFYGVSAQLMRRILVDFARRRPRAQGGSVRHVSLDEALLVAAEPDADLVALDEALEALAQLDPRKARIVELRFFGGLSVEETAEFLGVSPATALREWNKAKAWLYRELSVKG
ncbi:MAG: sigma-70 family RNA polymerase sigma factor [Pyrinomonadaceae bacterium]|nr:sigma-70 family RNA polymerase sigma factor [Pyrinomonadaceae bacterium]